MEAAIALGVLHHAVALRVELPAVGKVFVRTLGEVVLIHEVVSRVVGRIDVDHLDLAEVGLLQQLQHLEVVALDVEVLRRVEVHALLAAGTQRLVERGVGEQDGLPLVRPRELVSFLVAVHHAAGNLLRQRILVDRPDDLAVLINRLRHGVGKHRRQLFEVLVGLVRRLHPEFIHCLFSPVHES